MNIGDQIETVGDCVYYRPVGTASLPEVIRQVAEVIKFTRDRRIPKLFVNITGLTGFPSPTLGERYFIAREWAAAAQGCVRAVLVVPIEMIDPDKFGITAARNAGMDAAVFPTEAEALAWLASEAGV